MWLKFWNIPTYIAQSHRIQGSKERKRPYKVQWENSDIPHKSTQIKEIADQEIIYPLCLIQEMCVICYPRATTELLSSVSTNIYSLLFLPSKNRYQIKEDKISFEDPNLVPDMGNVYCRSTQENVFFYKTTVI